MLDDVPQHLEIETQETPHAGVKQIALIGGLTLETVSAFNLKLREETAPVILLDLSKLEWLDSAGAARWCNCSCAAPKAKAPSRSPDFLRATMPCCKSRTS